MCENIQLGPESGMLEDEIEDQDEREKCFI